MAAFQLRVSCPSPAVAVRPVTCAGRAGGAMGVAVIMSLGVPAPVALTCAHSIAVGVAVG